MARTAPEYGRAEHVGSIAFGSLLTIERFRFANGLALLLCEDHSAPVVAYQTWFRVGSRHERPGKTGLAHLFEHLMFNESEGCPQGEYDRRLEEAGAENNASTWLDWTQYTVAAPADQLAVVVELEANRMGHLVLRDPQVGCEKEVVANERRFRVEDDVEGTVSETLWTTAFDRHPYRWPTIGWMEDIEGFTTDDCLEFYRTHYAPNNATIVVVGDVNEADVVRRLADAYGRFPPGPLALEDCWPEPPQTEERQREIRQPSATEKLAVGYHGPALGDADHAAVSVLAEVLFGGRASRCHQTLVRDREIAIETRAFVGQFRDPGLIEIFAATRSGHTAEELLAAIDLEIERVRAEPVPEAEIERARARLELALVSGLETADGKATTIGFFDAVLGQPALAFERLAALRSIDANALLRAARRYLSRTQRTVILVRIRESATGGGPMDADPDGPLQIADGEGIGS
ncbi:MAG: insulinase family protein [Polyangiaceae bacterium]|nr:insulinase family protein [Polyangiaceae bacterium]